MTDNVIAADFGSAATDIPATLRRLANDIEKGEYGTVHNAVCIVSSDMAPLHPFIFGMGQVDGPFHPLAVMARGSYIFLQIERGET